MKYMRIFVLPALLLSVYLSVSGCCKREDGTAGIVARINNYELTTDDFREKARVELVDRNISKDPKKARMDILEELIVKNILVQEAQAQNFDKDRAFMREIESYWEQALLKLLIKRKTEEFASQVTSGDKEARRAKVQEMLEAWVKDIRNRANVRIYKENLEAVDIK